MRAAQTQIAAFQAITPKHLGATQQMVMDCFTDPTVRLTREEIAARTNMKLSSVCGRVRELLDDERLAVRGTRKDPHMRNAQQVVGLPTQDAATSR
jgi:hypothetical protein